MEAIAFDIVSALDSFILHPSSFILCPSNHSRDFLGGALAGTLFAEPRSDLRQLFLDTRIRRRLDERPYFRGNPRSCHLTLHQLRDHVLPGHDVDVPEMLQLTQMSLHEE